MFADSVYSELDFLHSEEKRLIFPRFFKAGKGEYGEGDKFIGVTVPNMRLVAKSHEDASLEDIDSLLCSPWHEMRLCGLLILVEQVKRTKTRKWLKEHSEDEAEKKRKEVFDFYLCHTERINNWDLVDLTAPAIVGEYLLDKDRTIIYKLADSSLLWEQRIAIVSTYAFIRANDYDDIYRLSSLLINHKHDLIHKALGWMLREAGKRDKAPLLDFLDEHAASMPRTMLRYSIEKFNDVERKYYMNMKQSVKANH
ncbi:MAG: DNA alkylation repair protein [Prevotellaceae bacterium]|nr:DNA alkylation repair protein [Prevotellaceae bacterium]